MKIYMSHFLDKEQPSILDEAKIENRLLSFYFLHIIGHLRRNKNDHILSRSRRRKRSRKRK